MVLHQQTIDRIIEPLPGKGSGEAGHIDYQAIKRALDTEVYVDRRVKDKLLGYFALKRLDSASRKSILCLLAPPGMGKTSIVKSLCDALSWKLIVIPVGEMTDDDGALLGNRRADINATAGRIINAIKGVKPGETIVLLQNIDRTDLTGLSNFSASFFEVLNHVHDYAIRNNYLTNAIDLSQISFMATASNISTIPQGVREEMDMVTIPSYGELEKLKIVRNHIMPQLLKDYGLTDRLAISDNALKSVIRGYTREAGVSELHKNLAAICQRALKKLTEKGDQTKVKINKRSLSSYLGGARYSPHLLSERDEVGVISLLGRSDRGGCVLTLESLIIEGEGKLVLTGNLDNTFHESALVAIDYIRSRSEKFGVEADFHTKYDIHLHIQEAATPKYGVSAGMAIVTALVSSLTGRPVRRGIGMTGEVSLHGKVLGVRDIRDKAIAAYQAGIRTVFVPAENEFELKYMPAEVRREISFYPLKSVDIAVEKALVSS